LVFLDAKLLKLRLLKRYDIGDGDSKNTAEDLERPSSEAGGKDCSDSEITQESALQACVDKAGGLFEHFHARHSIPLQ